MSRSQARVTHAQFAEPDRAIEQAIADAYRKGYDAGVKAGKRLAKGKPPLAKARGRQKVLHDIWALQFVDYVESLFDGRKVSLGAAVQKYRDLMTPAWEELHERKPSQAALMRLYQRIKKGKHNIDARMRRNYELLERGCSST